MTLPTNFTDTTVSAGTHPGAHNATNTRVNALELVAPKRAAPGKWLYAHDPTSIAAVALGGYVNHMLLARAAINSAFDRMAAQVTTAVAASVWKWAIYRSDANGMPTTLAASGQFDSATIGVKIATLTALPAGIYWLGFFTAAAISARCSQAGNPLHVLAADTPNPTDIYPMAAWALFMPSGTIPDPFPTASAINSTTMVAAMLRCA